MTCLYHAKQSKVLLKWSRKPEEHTRRERVYRLLLKNLSPREISEALESNTQTVERDISAIQSKLEEWLRRNPDLLKDRMATLLSQLDGLDNITREAWLQYHQLPDGSGAKVKALDLVRQVQQDQARLLGLLQTSIVAMEVKESALDRLVRAVVVQSNTMPLSEAQMNGGVPLPAPVVDLEAVKDKKVETASEPSSN